MERDYEKELKENALYQFLRRNNGCKIYWSSETGEHSATFSSNGSSVYYCWKDETYHRYDMSTDSCRKFNSKGLLNDMLKITRVEKQFEDKWLPVWTSVDGFIESDYKHFVYIQGKYYTLNELDTLISELKTIKMAIAKLNVY